MKTYQLNVAEVKRELPIVQISEHVKIASFVVLGDAELVSAAAPQLAEKLPDVDVLVTAEAKGIPFVHEVAKQLHMTHYVVARKSVKLYMDEPLINMVHSITTQSDQMLCLGTQDVKRLQGKRVALIDDVISSGESIKALEELVIKAGGNVVAKAAILAEGEAGKRKDITFLDTLPVFTEEK